MLTNLLVAVSAVMTPPDQPVVNHAQPPHYAQPTIPRFIRRNEDEARRLNWQAYCRELDELWRQYRAAGSTPAAMTTYKAGAAQAKRRYLYADPYLQAFEQE